MWNTADSSAWRSTGCSCNADHTCCTPQGAENLTPACAVRQVLLFAAIAATVVTTIFMEQVRDTQTFLFFSVRMCPDMHLPRCCGHA